MAATFITMLSFAPVALHKPLSTGRAWQQMESLLHESSRTTHASSINLSSQVPVLGHTGIHLQGASSRNRRSQGSMIGRFPNHILTKVSILGLVSLEQTSYFQRHW